jgi:FkbM family methyltransferase
MFSSWKESLVRKKARRITQEYPPKVETFQIEQLGTVEFANWTNPLVAHMQTRLSTSMIAFFKQFIKEGDLAIDIGANIGDTTVPIGLATGATGLTVGFDPNPYVFKILQKNATLNPGKMNIAPEPYAISVKEDEYYFISSEASFSNGGLSKTLHSKHGKFIYPNKVKGVNLHSFLKEHYSPWLSKLSFIKVDAEGYDKEILKSIADLIAKYKPAIVAESFGTASNDEKMELFDVIANLGYEIYYTQELDASAKTKKIENRKEITNWKETINIYAIPSDRK